MCTPEVSSLLYASIQVPKYPSSVYVCVRVSVCACVSVCVRGGEGDGCIEERKTRSSFTFPILFSSAYMAPAPAPAAALLKVPIWPCISPP